MIDGTIIVPTQYLGSMHALCEEAPWRAKRDEIS